MAQGCGFPHTQAAKRTAASDSAAFDKLRPRASRGELVAGRQSLKKRFYGLAAQENATESSFTRLRYGCLRAAFWRVYPVRTGLLSLGEIPERTSMGFLV